MMKVSLLILVAAIGTVLGVSTFFVIDFTFPDPFVVGEVSVWRGYGLALLGGVGAFCGVLMGKVVHACFDKPLELLPVISDIPPANVADPSRRNCRPLTWLYRE